jgi:hypothetical protein
LEGSGTTPCFNWEATAPFVPETLGTSEILPHDLSTTRLIPNICPEVIRAEHDATAPPRTTTSSIRNEKTQSIQDMPPFVLPSSKISHTPLSCYLTISKEFPKKQKKKNNKNEKNENTNKTRARSMRVSFLHHHLRASTSAIWKEREKNTHTNTTTTTRWNKNQQQRQQILYGFSSSHTAFVLQILFVWLKSLKPGILSPSVRC